MRPKGKTWRELWRETRAALRTSPEAVAMGTAIGVFIAFTPTLGFHMVLALLLASFLKANRSAAVLSVWVVNPFTLVPAFLLAYYVGRAVLFLPPSGEDLEKVLRLLGSEADKPPPELLEFFKAFAALGFSAILALTVGGTLLGLAGAALVYPLILWIGRGYRWRPAKRGDGDFVVNYQGEATVTPEQDQELRELLATCYKRTLPPPGQHYLKQAPLHHWLARDRSGRLVGHVAAHEKTIQTAAGSRRMAGVADVCVHPDARGRGLFRRMLADAHAWLAAHAFDFSVLFGKREIYGSSGYMPVSNFSHRPPADADPVKTPWERSTCALVKPLSDMPWPSEDVYMDSRSF
jgi:uncharacterized protein (DUF2062 family)/GNAT superfamily N-acetyltransferase